jgi:anti-sigma-K factor RskA
MSTLYLFPPEQEQPEDRDLLAAEYALGLLDAGDAASLRLRAEADGDLRHAVAVWQARLALLIEILPREAPPIALWQRLAADIGLPEPRPAPAPEPPIPAPVPAPISVPVQVSPETPNLFARLSEPPPTSTQAPPVPEPANEWEPVPTVVAAPTVAAPSLPLPVATFVPAPLPSGPPWHARLLVWRIATAVLLVIVVLLGVRALTPHGASRQVAAIGPTGAPAPLFLAETDAAGHLTLTPLATIAVPNGRDLELWTVPADHATAPVPLGVLPVTGRMFDLASLPPEGTQLLVSMEIRGGAAGGVLTGPVLYAGTLANH